MSGVKLRTTDNGRTLFYDGFTYKLERVHGGKSYWKCQRYRKDKCPGRAIKIEANRVFKIKITQEHRHSPEKSPTSAKTEAPNEVCALCHRGKTANNVCGFLHRQPLVSGECLVAHQKCMQYSAKLIQFHNFSHFGGFYIDKVQEEIQRGKRLKCYQCMKEKKHKRKVKVTGATAGCEWRKCPKSFHFYCARKYCFPSRRRRQTDRGKLVDLYWVFCSAEHKRKYLQSDAGKQEESCNETDDDGEHDDEGEEDRHQENKREEEQCQAGTSTGQSASSESDSHSVDSFTVLSESDSHYSSESLGSPEISKKQEKFVGVSVVCKSTNEIRNQNRPGYSKVKHHDNNDNKKRRNEKYEINDSCSERSDHSASNSTHNSEDESSFMQDMPQKKSGENKNKLPVKGKSPFKQRAGRRSSESSANSVEERKTNAKATEGEEELQPDYASDAKKHQQTVTVFSGSDEETLSVIHSRMTQMTNSKKRKKCTGKKNIQETSNQKMKKTKKLSEKKEKRKKISSDECEQETENGFESMDGITQATDSTDKGTESEDKGICGAEQTENIGNLECSDSASGSMLESSECVLVILEDHSLLMQVAEEVEKKFGQNKKHIHSWSTLHPDVLPSNLIWDYFYDVAGALKEGNWSTLRNLLKGSERSKPRSSYFVKVEDNSAREEELRETVIENYKLLIKKRLLVATEKNNRCMGEFIESPSVCYLWLIINDTCDPQHELRRVLHTQHRSGLE